MAASEHRPLGQIMADLAKATDERKTIDQRITKLRVELEALADAATTAAESTR